MLENSYLEQKYAKVYAKERAILAKHKKEGSRVDSKKDKLIHTDIRACVTFQDLEKIVKNEDEIKSLDNSALALIIEGSSCKDMITTYIEYVDRYGIEDVLDENNEFKPMLKHGAGFIYTTAQFTKSDEANLAAAFGKNIRGTQ